MSLKDLKDRYNAPMHSFWKKIQRFCIAFALTIPTSTELSEYYNFLPEGSIPQWLKTIVGVIITAGIIVPKFTIEDKKQDTK